MGHVHNAHHSEDQGEAQGGERQNEAHDGSFQEGKKEMCFETHPRTRLAPHGA